MLNSQTAVPEGVEISLRCEILHKNFINDQQPLVLVSETSVGLDLVTREKFSFSIGHYRNVRGLGKSMVVFRLFEN